MSRGVPSIEEVENEEHEKLKAWCRKHGWVDCNHCGSSTASGWCCNHPDYGKEEKQTVN